jgi:hypothetical protein
LAARYAPLASSAVSGGGYQSIVLNTVFTATSAVPSASSTPATEILYGALSTSGAVGLIFAVSVDGSYSTVAGIVDSVVPSSSCSRVTGPAGR